MTKTRLLRALVEAAQHTARSHQDHSHLWLAADRAAVALGMPESPAGPVAADPSASTGAVVGEDAGSGQETTRGGGRVEVRHQTGDDGKPYLDEVIARGADVHLESMSESDWLLILEWADGRRVDVWIGSRSGRAAVDGRVTEDSGGGR